MLRYAVPCYALLGWAGLGCAVLGWAVLSLPLFHSPAEPCCGVPWCAARQRVWHDALHSVYLACQQRPSPCGQEHRPAAAKSLDDARAAVRDQRGNLTLAVALEEARKEMVLFRGAADVADAYAAFVRSAANTAESFEVAAAALRARSEQVLTWWPWWRRWWSQWRWW